MKLALGTAQFGMPYGISNLHGQPSLAQIEGLIRVSTQYGLNVIDTASSYGTSEEVLGLLAPNHICIISKLKPIPYTDNIAYHTWVRLELETSLNKLRRQKLWGYLLHNVDDLQAGGEELWEAMLDLKLQKLVDKIGYSVYSPLQVEKYFDRFTPDIVQLPLNVLDNEFLLTGWLEILKSKGVEIHARSAFLQGLLLMDFKDQMKRFPSFEYVWKAWKEYLTINELTAIEACIGFLYNLDSIDRIVVGVNSAHELMDILKVSAHKAIPPFEFICRDPDLIYPFNWKS